MENEKKFHYKSFLRTMYALFGLFMALNGFFVFRKMIKMKGNHQIIGGLMFAAGAIALFLFYFYTKVPYVTLLGTSKLKFKAHPLYSEKLISKDYVKSITEVREKVYEIIYSDSNGAQHKTTVNAAMIDNEKQAELVSIIKSFSPESKSETPEEKSDS